MKLELSRDELKSLVNLLNFIDDTNGLFKEELELQDKIELALNQAIQDEKGPQYP